MPRFIPVNRGVGRTTRANRSSRPNGAAISQPPGSANRNRGGRFRGLFPANNRTPRWKTHGGHRYCGPASELGFSHTNPRLDRTCEAEAAAYGPCFATYCPQGGFGDSARPPCANPRSRSFASMPARNRSTVRWFFPPAPVREPDAAGHHQRAHRKVEPPDPRHDLGGHR
jgi:hypothetical protein